MKNVKNQTLWTLPLTDAELKNGHDATNVEILTKAKNGKYVKEDGDMMIGETIFSKGEQIALRDILISVHPIDVQPQKDY